MIALVATIVVPTRDVAAAEPCAPGSNPIVCENSHEGADPEEWEIDGAGDDDIQGFSTDISVNVGSRIDFKIDTDASHYMVKIYRTGYYDNAGARFIQAVTPLAQPQAAQPACITVLATQAYDCGTWNVSASWAVPATAVSGVYIAVLERADTGGRSHITFIVRDQASHSDIVFQTSDPTWQAYNTYGGSDFYQGGANNRSYTVSYNRPMATRGAFEGRDFYFSAEFAAVQFLERNGYDVSYISGVDTDRYGSLLTNHNVFLSVGHDEYWSAAQRANVEAARDAGVNLQFLSGNEAYWRTRYEPSLDPSATPYRTLVSYKETWAGEKLDDSTPQWTGTWRDPRFASPSNGGGLPENAVTGTAYIANHSDLAITVTAAQGKMRLWRGTGLSSMVGSSQALAPHTVGYESNEDLDNGFRPSGLVRMSTTVGQSPQVLLDFGKDVAQGTTTHHLTLYRADASNALVFSAGSVQWSWGLWQNHDGNGAPADLRIQQAQVNLLADMDALPLTLASTLVAATKTSDQVGPATTVTSPAAGATVGNGTTVTVAGTASDSAGRVAGVNVSTDNGVTWHPANGTTAWSYSYVQEGHGSRPVRIKAIDDSGNASVSSVNYTVAGPYGVIGNQVAPAAASTETGDYQLGLAFTPTIDGFVSGVRFYKDAANTGVHSGSLWNTAGIRLANVVFGNETASGWQSATFTSAVAVTADTEYIVSYRAPNGHYTANSYEWITRGETAGPLTVAGGYAAMEQGRSAGVFANGEAFPNRRAPNAAPNYFVDPIFDVIDTTPLTTSAPWPVGGATSVPVGTTMATTLSKQVVPSSVAHTLTSAAGASVAGTTAYDPGTKKATFTPSAPLAENTSYTLTVSATAATGGTITAGATRSFRTALPANPVGVCPCGLYTDASEPVTVQAADTNAVTLGVRLTPTVNGEITGIRFYKSAASTGSHTATLWSGGVAVATAVFQNESAAGWQTATFASPYAVTAGTSYIASYRTSVGNYSATAGAYTGATSRGPLAVPAEGGTYNYGTTVPLSTTSTSYLVDVVFMGDVDPITLVSTTPGDGATLVSRSTSIQATLSRPVAPGYSLTASIQGAPVAGSSALSSDGRTITFTPSAALPNGAVVQVTLAGVVSTQGATLATQNWSFTAIDETTTAVTSYTLFGTETPQTAASSDGSAVELGLAFTPSTAGSVTGIRFYKGAGNTGAHVGHLWAPDGSPMATVQFTNETASGWQTAQLSTAVALTAGQTYTVSYFAPEGHYAHTPYYFSTAKTSGPLSAQATTNGRYLYGPAGGRPTASHDASNYYVDVVYSVVGPPPAAAPVGLFGTEAPAEASSGDSSPIEVGVAFTPSVAGEAKSIRFYKGPGNGGTHVGHLFPASGGAPLATVTFANETASGWQTAELTTPVALVAGQKYVVSYVAPQGNFAFTRNYFTTPKTTGPLTAGTDNGRFLYGPGGTLPTGSYGATNYFVDVGFLPTP